MQETLRDAGSIPRSGRSPGGGNGNQSVQQVCFNPTKTSQLVLIFHLHSNIPPSSLHHLFPYIDQKIKIKNISIKTYWVATRDYHTK